MAAEVLVGQQRSVDEPEDDDDDEGADEAAIHLTV